MPSIMGAFDAIIEHNRVQKDIDLKTSTPKRSLQVSNFANLSPCVQKILANVPDQELNKRFNSEETLGPRRFLHRNSVYRSLRSPEKQNNRYKSNESLDIISPNVQKMLSNFPETELVLPSSDRNNKSCRNGSSLYLAPKVACSEGDSFCENSVDSECDNLNADDVDNNSDVSRNNDENGSPKPLGSYLHTSQGIASRTPVGRKHMGKFLQVRSI